LSLTYLVYSQAGVILEQLDTKLGEVGMMVPLDLGAKAGDHIFRTPTAHSVHSSGRNLGQKISDDILSSLPRAVVI
jgi:hypothetical protein